MADSAKIRHPELFFGFVAPVGADLDSVVGSFRSYFERRDYRVIDIKATDAFLLLEKYISPKRALERSDPHRRYETYIAYGNQLRSKLGDDVLAATAIRQIVRKRLKIPEDERYSKTVYLIHQFKRKEEIELLRSVYGRLFFQISIYSRRGARLDYLSRKFSSHNAGSTITSQRPTAELLIQKDENEATDRHGQRVGSIFHDADFIANLDASETIERQISRFCELLFGSNAISPTHMEYGLFLAKSAALRTLDLSRQVGAAIFSQSGQIVALGSNEVPKAGGGTYWSDEKYDDRDYVRKADSNFERKKEILAELLHFIDKSTDVNKLIQREDVKDSQFMNALEYGRMVHAEMCALSDAARVGHAVNGGTLYCTTFPCHMCAKHIVAAGISKVVFLEPYPKSLAATLHSDSIRIEGGDRGGYQEFPAVDFEHFHGVSPRRYREIFERGSRKNSKTGAFKKYTVGTGQPIFSILFPFYSQLEVQLTMPYVENLKRFAPKKSPRRTKRKKTKKKRKSN